MNDKPQLLPANPGFSTLEFLEPQGEYPAAFVREPVIGWFVHRDGGAQPVGVSFLSDPDEYKVIEYPSGEVFDNSWEITYDNAADWLKARLAEYARETVKDLV